MASDTAGASRSGGPPAAPSRAERNRETGAGRGSGLTGGGTRRGRRDPTQLRPAGGHPGTSASAGVSAGGDAAVFVVRRAPQRPRSRQPHPSLRRWHRLRHRVPPCRRQVRRQLRALPLAVPPRRARRAVARVLRRCPRRCQPRRSGLLTFAKAERGGAVVRRRPGARKAPRAESGQED